MIPGLGSMLTLVVLATNITAPDAFKIFGCASKYSQNAIHIYRLADQFEVFCRAVHVSETYIGSRKLVSSAI